MTGESCAMVQRSSNLFVLHCLSMNNKLSQHIATYQQRLMTSESYDTKTSSGKFPNTIIHCSNQSNDLFHMVNGALYHAGMFDAFSAECRVFGPYSVLEAPNRQLVQILHLRVGV